jgi:hypothetical protein
MTWRVRVLYLPSDDLPLVAVGPGDVRAPWRSVRYVVRAQSWQEAREAAIARLRAEHGPRVSVCEVARD